MRTVGVAAARLVFLGFLGLTGSIIYNALYLQDTHSHTDGASAPQRPSAGAPPVDMAKLPPASTDLPRVESEQGGSTLIVRAVQRELAARGFDVGQVDGKPSDKTRAAISAYQQKQGLPVTGTASDELLRHILLGDSAPASGATGSVTGQPVTAVSNDTSRVKAVQKVLADLGYSPGPVDGAMGEATSRAISAFQHDRKIPETGHITPELLGELARITGREPGKVVAER
jgi:peptidoglycan hydrolase-like protein with peptidoglycan-binding domain